ncbi:MAG: AAA family ATPase [Pseudomonadota bacterium]
MSYIDPQDVVRHLRPAKQPPAPVGVTAASLKAKTFKPISWVINDLIPDGLTMLAGKPKLGKSWLMLDGSVAVASGGYVLDRHCAQGDVLYAALEDNQRRLQGRMAKIRPMGDWPDRLTFWTEMERIEDGGLEQLRSWIESVQNPRLIVIDVFTKVRRAKGGSEGVYDSDYLAAAPLKKLADDTGVGIVIVHHLRKMAADGDPLDMVSGSTGLTGAMDTILVLNRGPEGVTLYGRGRDIEEIESAVQFDKQTCRWSMLGDASEVRLSAERRAIIDALRAESEPMSPNVISVVTGHPPGSTRRLLHSMAKDGEVIKQGRGKYTVPDINPPNIGNKVTKDQAS